MRTFVIAEIGSCHDANFEKALMLIEAAQETGADAAKFQWWSDPRKLAYRRRAEEYESIYRKYQVPTKWLEPLKKHCEKVGVEFMCTAYLPGDVAILEPLLKRFKIASFESEDEKFVRMHKEYRKPVYVSLGMAMELPRWTRGSWTKFPEVYSFLHCVSGYPTPIDQANIAKIRRYGMDGFSDHTTSVLTGGLAVAAGATIIEKHIHIAATDHGNPDYPHSLNVGQFKEYVDFIRLSEKALGSGERGIQPCEEAMTRFKVK